MSRPISWFLILGLTAAVSAAATLWGCKGKPATPTAQTRSDSTETGTLSPTAARGRTLAATCLACHNADLTPPLAPPLYGISRRYKKSTANKAAFVAKVSAFAAKPSQEAVLFGQAVKKMGLMKPVALPRGQLEAIATYFYEATFPPPCAHWQHAISAAKKSGDSDHARKDQRMYDRLCN